MLSFSDLHLGPINRMLLYVVPVHVAYMFCSQHINDLVKYRSSQQISVNKKGLHGIAGCWVVTFGVSH